MAVVSLTGGRPPKPGALKKAQGTARKDRQRRAPASSSPLERIPPPPRDLAPGEVAAWRELARLISPLKVTTAADMVAFRQMAVTLAVIESAREAIQKHGLIFAVETESGTVVRKRPEVEIMIAYKKQLAVELSRFGLTPADRERVSALGDDAGADPLDEFSVGGAGAA